MEKETLKRMKIWANEYHYPMYKTAVKVDEPYLYKVVTRVNYLTAALWLENRKLIKNKSIELPNRVNWLVMIKNFRRGIDIKLTL